MAKKWPEMVVILSFKKGHSFRITLQIFISAHSQVGILSCHHFWVGATAKQHQTHPKVMTNMVKKCSTLFSTDQRFIQKRKTIYNIHTLVIYQKISISTFARINNMGSAGGGLLKAVSAACKNPLPNLQLKHQREQQKVSKIQTELCRDR